MLWRLPHELLLSIIVALALIAAILWELPHPQTARGISREQERTATSSEPQTRAEESVSVLGIHPGEWGLIIATFLLWVATAKLVKAAEDTAQRQLRAYIFLEDAKVRQEGENYIIHYRITNFGQTPAHKIRLYYRALALDWNDGAPAIPLARDEDLSILGSTAPGRDRLKAKSPAKAMFPRVT
jgi:hypothetical protein